MSIYDGLEEALARFVSLMITMLFFVIYIFAQESVSFDWYSGIGFLGLFWLIQEVISVCLFYIFKFFSSRKVKQETKNFDQNQESNIIE